jgi:hypothetical protein
MAPKPPFLGVPVSDEVGIDHQNFCFFSHPQDTTTIDNNAFKQPAWFQFSEVDTIVVLISE